ncbi:hypothetical protein SDC9_180037 [bioreactor metagenome]|uniref:Uncharacterized protein n=1 Tax=bioreactor metagenome TaxID=1076179 RepID=A0A645H0P6_9ZZZZ
MVCFLEHPDGVLRGDVIGICNLFQRDILKNMPFNILLYLFCQFHITDIGIGRNIGNRHNQIQNDMGQLSQRARQFRKQTMNFTEPFINVHLFYGDALTNLIGIQQAG